MVRVVASIVVAALSTAACGGSDESPSQAGKAEPERTRAQEVAAREEPAAGMGLGEGRELFVQRCATCHGESGDGQGPGSAALTPKPRDFRDPAWQQSVSDEHIEKIVSYGGAAVGLSPMMPPQPDLANQPAKLAAIVAFVRSLEGGT